MSTVEVRFIDLTRTPRGLRDEIDAKTRDVVASGWFILGPECRAFEREFAAACGSSHAVGVGTGTDAIELALRALDIGPGDEVITQANTCVPTVAAILRAGATPVLCDVEPHAATMDPESLRSAIGPRTRAIVPVHLYGQCADMEAILALARANGLAVVEDCAQAHGALFHGRIAGTMGRMGCFSFYPTKNLGALGDAGAVITNEAALADRLRLLRQYGQKDRYEHVSVGVNSRLDELQAGVLRCKLPYLEAWNSRRAEIAAHYAEALERTPARPLQVLEQRRHVFHLYVMETTDRGTFQAEMRRRGVDTLIHYPLSIHEHPAYSSTVSTPVPLAVAERITKRIVSLPLYPQLTDREVSIVSGAVADSVAARA